MTSRGEVAAHGIGTFWFGDGGTHAEGATGGRHALLGDDAGPDVPVAQRKGFGVWLDDHGHRLTTAGAGGAAVVSDAGRPCAWIVVPETVAVAVTESVANVGAAKSMDTARAASAILRSRRTCQLGGLTRTASRSPTLWPGSIASGNGSSVWIV